MSTIKANTLLHSDGSTTTQPSIPALDKRMAKAWVNLDMATGTIQESYNISSVTDASVGKFTINMSYTFANANYVVIGTASGAGSGVTSDTSYHLNTTTSFQTLVKTNQVYIDRVVSYVTFGN